MKIQILLITTFFLMISTACSQNKRTNISTVNKKIEILGTPTNFLIPIFHFQENSIDYKHVDSVKIFTEILINNNIQSISLSGNANKNELLMNKNISKQRANTIASLLVELGYERSKIELIDEKDANPLSKKENEPKNRRVEIVIITN